MRRQRLGPVREGTTVASPSIEVRKTENPRSDGECGTERLVLEGANGAVCKVIFARRIAGGGAEDCAACGAAVRVARVRDWWG